MPGVDRRWLPPILIAAAFAASFALHGSVPSTVDLRLDGMLPIDPPRDTEPAPRVGALYLIPALALAMWLAFRAAPTAGGQRLARKMFPKSPEAVTSPAQFERFGQTYDTIVLAVVLLLLGFHATVMAAVLDYQAIAVRVGPAALGACMILMGNVTPRLRPNWVAGLRTQRMLSDPQLWRSAHRTFGRALVAAGAATFVVALAAPRYGLVTGIALLLVSLVVGLMASSKTGSGAPQAV